MSEVRKLIFEKSFCTPNRHLNIRYRVYFYKKYYKSTLSTFIEENLTDEFR